MLGICHYTISMVKYNLPDCNFLAETAHTSNQWTNAEEISIILSNEKGTVRYLPSQYFNF